MKAILAIDSKNTSMPTTEKSTRVFFDQCLSSQINFKYSLKNPISAIFDQYVQSKDRAFDIWRFLTAIRKEINDNIGIQLIADPIMLEKRATFHFSPGRWHFFNATNDKKIRKVRIALSNLRAVLPSFDWFSYFDELLPRDLKEKYPDYVRDSVIDVDDTERLEAIANEISNMDITNPNALICKFINEAPEKDNSNDTIGPRTLCLHTAVSVI